MSPSCCELTRDDVTIRLLSGVYYREGMNYTALDDDDTYRPELPNLWERTPSYAPNPGYFGRECTPSVIWSSPDPEEIVDERSSPSYESQFNQLGFMPVTEREDRRIPNGQPPNCINYLIEWKVILNNRLVAKYTEQDLALPPSSY